MTLFISSHRAQGYMFKEILGSSPGQRIPLQQQAHSKDDVCHKDTQSIHDPIYMITCVTAAHTVHTASSHISVGIPRVLCVVSSATEQRCSGTCGHVERIQQQHLVLQSWTGWTVFPIREAHRARADSSLCESEPTLPACPLHHVFWTSKYSNIHIGNLWSAGQ